MMEEACRWPVSEHTPEAVADQLWVARDLFTHCFLVWEFGAVGIAWSLLAVESNIRAALDARESAPFKALVRQARTEGLLTEDLAETVDAGRQLRNMFSHPKSQPTWTVAMTAGSIRQPSSWFAP